MSALTAAPLQGEYLPKKIWEPLDGSQALALCCPCNHILYEGTRGPGKGLPLTEPVYTPDGPITIGSLKEGDLVCCPDGTVSPIVGVYPQGKRKVYKITFFDGSVARCDDQHIWNLHVGGKNPAGVYKNYTMSEVLNMFKVGVYRLNVPTLNEIKMQNLEQPVPIEAYTLGLFLGDGSSAQRVSFCTTDDELANHVLQNGFREQYTDARNDLRNFAADQNFKDSIKALGLGQSRSHDKFVPKEYLNNSKEIRLSVLQGLMDTDGTIDKRGYITFCSISEQLAKDVQYLARSLGARATISDKFPTINGVEYTKAYNVYIQTGNKFCPFRLQRKVSRIIPYMHKHLTNKIVSIEEQEPEETVCIKIDHKEGLFITNDFVVTHNTDAQIMYFRRFVGLGYGQFWRGVIFDLEYKNLDDLMAKSKRWYRQFGDGAKFLSSKGDLKWVWPTGEELWFRVMKCEDDYWNYHGHEFPFIGWNELTKQANSSLYDMSMSLNRSSFIPALHSPKRKDGSLRLLPEIPLVVFSTTNPYGVGHNWVKQRFIDPAPPGQIIKIQREVFNPRTQTRELITKTQVRLFGSYKENIYLAPEYILELESIVDPNKRAAWLWGDWDITSGGMFDDVWSSQYNIVEPFNVPPEWRIFRSFDWGSSKPFSVGWWCESDGGDLLLANGKWKSTVRGDLFRIAEWYGWNGVPNTGLRMLATKIAQGIIEREIKMGIHKRVKAGPADNSINDDMEGTSIALEMAKKVKINGKEYKGVTWTPSNKSPGSRKNGWELMRVAIYNAHPPQEGGPRENPGLFIVRGCQDGFIRTVPTLPRCNKDLDDVDTNAEDHVADESRYVILSTGNRFSFGTTTGNH